MRTIYILFLLLISTSLTYAQTITPDWFFTEGDSLQIVTITNVNDFQEPTSGLNQDWDYSTTITATDTAILRFVDPSTLTTNADFKRADVATAVPGIQEVFYDTEGDTLSILGISIFGPNGLVQVKYNIGNEELIARDQMIFGDTLFRTIIGEILLDGEPVQSLFLDQELSFSGIGTLQLPDITLDNCVHFSNSIIQNGQEIGKITTIFFNSFSNQVLTYSSQQDAYGQTVITMSQGITDGLNTSIAEIDLLQANIFSDLSGNVFVDLEESIDASVQIVAMNGQVVAHHQEALSAGRNQLSLNNNLSTGIYAVLIVDKKTGRFNSHKLSLMK